jgi:hypothetical protein
MEPVRKKTGQTNRKMIYFFLIIMNAANVYCWSNSTGIVKTVTKSVPTGKSVSILT